MKNVIYLSSQKAVLVQGNVTKNGIRIEKYSSLDLPSGVILEDGSIADISQASEQISDLILMADVGSKKFTLCLDVEGILFKEMAVPKLKKSNQKPLIINEFLSDLEDAEQYIVDYIVTSDLTDNGQMMVLAYGMKQALIEQYTSFFKGLGLICTCIDLSSNALSKLSSLEAGTGNGAWCIMEIDKDVTTFKLIDNGCCRFTQRVKAVLPKPEPEPMPVKIAEEKPEENEDKKETSETDSNSVEPLNLSDNKPNKTLNADNNLKEANEKEEEIPTWKVIDEFNDETKDGLSNNVDTNLSEEELKERFQIMTEARNRFKEALNTSLKKLYSDYDQVDEYQKARASLNEIQGIYLVGSYGDLPAVREAVIETFKVPCKLIGEAGKIIGDAEFFPYQYGIAIGALIRRS